MKFANTKKTPVAQLAGESDEGLNSPLTKKESTTMVPNAAVPTQLDFDGLTVDTEPVGDHLELTVAANGRATFGIALTPAEARKLASALLDAAAPAFGQSPVEEIEEHAAVARKVPVEIPVSDLAAGTVTDIFRFATDHDLSSGDVMQAVEDFIDEMAEAESLTPAKWCKRWRQIHQEARA